MKAKSAIEKGKKLEQHICDRLADTGLDVRAKKSPGSGNGNREKADIDTCVQINGRNIGIEAKNHKVVKIPEWWKQAKKLEELGREPVLAFKLPRDEYAGTLVCIYLETFLELLQGNSEHLESIIEKPSLKFKIKRLKDAAHDVFKELG